MRRHVASRIRQLRVERGLTRAQLTLLVYGRTSDALLKRLQRYEGEAGPSIEYVVALTRALGEPVAAAVDDTSVVALFRLVSAVPTAHRPRALRYLARLARLR